MIHLDPDFIPSDNSFFEKEKAKSLISEDPNWGIFPEKMSEFDFIKGVSFLPGSSYGKRCEKRIANTLGCRVLLDNDGNGDIVSPKENHYEVKTSILTISGTSNLNVVQIRPNETCDYILVAYDMRISKSEEFTKHIFLLNRKEMMELCITLNAGTAHGKRDKRTTEELISQGVELRFSIPVKEGNKKWELISKYKISGWEELKGKI